LSLTSFLQYRFTTAFKAGVGLGYEYFRIEKPAGRYVSSTVFPEIQDIAEPSKYGTIRSYADIDYVNNSLFPSTGVRWRSEANYFKEFSGSHNFIQLKSDISFYATPNFSFPVTAAIRLGTATNIGSYKFFQANSLGGNSNLRGFRNNRFSGRSYFYENSELRFKVSKFRNYIFTGDFGILGFLDAGRVYSDLPESAKWHMGYGPGIWTNFYHKLLFSTGYGISKEGRYLFLKLGLPY
jgi:outer membrane translocation and assembly module TamA